MKPWSETITVVDFQKIFRLILHLLFPLTCSLIVPFCLGRIKNEEFTLRFLFFENQPHIAAIAEPPVSSDFSHINQIQSIQQVRHYVQSLQPLPLQKADSAE